MFAFDRIKIWRRVSVEEKETLSISAGLLIRTLQRTKGKKIHAGKGSTSVIYCLSP